MCRLGVLDGHADRSRIELDGSAVRAVLDEVDRRRREADAVMDLTSAAERLALPLGQVEKPYRARTLEPAPSPTGTTRRHVTVASAEAVGASRQVAVAASRRVVRLNPRARCCASPGSGCPLWCRPGTLRRRRSPGERC